MSGLIDPICIGAKCQNVPTKQSTRAQEIVLIKGSRTLRDKVLTNHFGKQLFVYFILLILNGY
jgi:hypothetical protein